MISRPKVIVAPTVEPLSWAEAAEHCRIDNEDERGYVELLIKAVRQNLERRTGRAFIEQTLEVTVDYWPRGGVIELPRATPLHSIEAFEYTDSTSAITSVDPTTYVIDTTNQPGRLTHVYGSFWPTYTPSPLSSIRIRYIAGHVGIDGSPQIPFPDEDILHAMKFLVGHFYAHREGVIVGKNLSIQSYQIELGISSLLVNHEMPNLF